MSELRRSRRGKCAHIARRRSAVLNRAIRAVMENLENRQYMSVARLADDDNTNFTEGQCGVNIHFVNDDAGTMSATVDYGDGSEQEHYDDFADGDGYLGLSHNFADDGEMVSVTVSGGDGDSVFTWTVQDAAPTADLAANTPGYATNYVGIPVQAYFENLSYASDDGPLHYSFARDPNNLKQNYDDAGILTDNSDTFTFDSPGSYTIYGNVIDSEGKSNTYQTTVDVADDSPTADLVNTGPIDEGQNATVSFSNVTNPLGETLHYSIAESKDDLGTDTGSSKSFHFGRDGVYTIYGKIWSTDASSSIMQTQIVVRDLSPNPTITQPSGSVNEGAPYTLTLSDTVHGDDKVTQWTIDWGDGTDPQNYTSVSAPANGAQTATATHTYALQGTYNITASVLEDSGEVYSATPAKVDTTFGTNGTKTVSFGGQQGQILATARQADGKIVMVGGDGTGFLVARYTSASDGELDDTFGANGTAQVFHGSNSDHYMDVASAVATYWDPGSQQEKIIVAGEVYQSSTWLMGIARYKNNGTLDTTFGPAHTGTMTSNFSNYGGSSISLLMNVNGTLAGFVVVGYTYGSTGGVSIARFDAAGNLDTTFGLAGTMTDPILSSANAVAVQGDGSFVVGGNNGIARFSADGTLDTTFGVDGIVQTPDLGAIWNVSLQPDGKVIAVGQHQGASATGGFYVGRYNIDGSPDLSFGTSGEHFTGVVIDPSLISPSFNFNVAFAPLVQRGDGTFQIAGSYGAVWDPSIYNVIDRIVLVSYDDNGNVDPTFGNNGFLSNPPSMPLGSASPVSVYQVDGKLLVVGQTWARFEFGGLPVIVNNVDPTVTLDPANNGTVAEGETYVLNFSSFDPGDDTVSQWVVNWGDGTDLETIPGDASSATHVYDDSHVGVDTIKATVYEDDGESADNTFNLTVLPAAPTGLVATAVSSTAVQLDWSDNTDAETGYTVEWGTDGNTFPHSVAASGSNETTVTSALFDPSTTYYFRVKANGPTGDSEYSDISSTATLATGDLPTTITDLQASFVTDHIALSWSDAFNETAYTVQKRDGLDGQWTDLITTLAAGSGGSISYDDDSRRDPDHTYYYRVFGTNSVGAGALSNQASYTTSISAPTNLTGDTSVSGQVTLTWYDNADNEENFKIYRWDTTHPTPVVYAIPGSSGRGLFSYTITGLSTLIYGFKVIASTSTLESDGAVWSEGILPDVPADLGASINGSMISLTWTDSTGEDHYTVQKRDGLDGLWTTLTTTVAANSVGYNDDGEQDPEHTYYYRVFATNSAGPSDASNEASVTTSITAPDNLQASGADDDNVVLTWQDNSENEEGFNIYQWDNTDSTKVLIGTLPAHQSTGSVSFTVGGLDIGPMYSFEVRAFIGATELSAGSVNATPVDQGITAEGPTTANYGDYEVLLSSPGLSGSLDWTIDWGDGTSSSFSGDASDPENHPLTSTHHYSEPSDDSTSLFTISVEAKYGTTTWYADDLNVEMSDGGAELAPVQNDPTPAETRKAILQAFQDVYNTIKYEPYAGLMKGAIGVEQTKSGNDWDQAALLKSKLASIGVTSSYAFAKIQVSAANVRKWLGVRDDDSAFNLLQKAGLFDPQDNNPFAGGFFYIEHAWLRIDVPNDVAVGGTQTWTSWDLDPSWKYQVIRKRTTNQQTAIDAIGATSALFDSATYIGTKTTDDPLQWYESQITNYIRNQPSLKGQTSLSDLPPTGPIIAKNFLTPLEKSIGFTIQPAVVEYTVFSGFSTTSNGVLSDGQDMRDRVRISVHSGDNVGANTYWEFNTSDLGTDAVRIQFVNQPLSGESSIASTYVRAELFVGDSHNTSSNKGHSYVDVHPGTDGIYITVTVAEPTVDFSDDAEVRTDTFQQKDALTLAPVAFMLNAHQYGPDTINALQKNLNDLGAKTNATAAEKTTYQGKLLDLIEEKYAYELNIQTANVTSMTGTIAIPHVQYGIVRGVNVTPTRSENLQNPWVFYDAKHHQGIRVDLPGLGGGFASSVHNGNQARENNALLAVGYVFSWLENSVLESACNTEAMSTVKGLEWATSHGFLIDTIRSSSEADSLYTTLVAEGFDSSWASSVKDGVSKAIQKGETVSIAPWVSVGGWSGVVWEAHSTQQIECIIQRSGDSKASGGDGFASASAVLQLVQAQIPTNTGKVNALRGDPVNMFSGGLYDDETDFSLPDPGLPLTFARHYSSTQNGTLNKDTWATNPLITNTADPNVGTTGPLGSNSDDQGMGVGWTYSYSDRLIGIGTSKVTWITSQGDRYEFDQIGTSSKFYDPSGLFGDFTFAGTGTSKIYTYREKDGTQHIFDYTGKLTKIKDRNNNELDIAHDNAGGLISSVSYKGPSDSNSTRIITFVVTDYHISSVTDFTGRTWAFTYSAPHFANGGVYLTDAAAPTTATGSGAIPKLHTQYSYKNDQGDSRDGLLKEIDRHTATGTGATRGSQKYEYYANGRVFSTTDADGHTEYFSYDSFRSTLSGSNAPVYTASANHTDFNGNTTESVFNENGLLTRTINPDGSRTDQMWMAYKLADNVNAPTGFLLRASTNEVGLTNWSNYKGERVAPSGATSYRLVDSGNVDTQWSNTTDFDPAAPDTHPGWDQPHITFSYDPKFNGVTTIATAGSVGVKATRTTTNVYDGNGNLTSTTDPVLGKTTFTYYGNGLLHTKMLPNGNAAPDTPTKNAYTITYNYFDGGAGEDDSGLVQSIVQNGTTTAAYTYDQFGNLHTEKDGTQYTYDTQGHQADRVTTYTYDLLGRKTKQVVSIDGTTNGQTGLTTSYNWSDNEIINVSLPGTDTESPETINTYDPVGQLTSATTLGVTTSTTYDPMGNAISSTDANNNVTQYIYDNRNRLVETLYSEGGYAINVYDGAGRIVQTITPSGTVQDYRFDPQAVTSTSYDSLGHVDDVVDPVNQETKNTYDGIGDLTETQFFTQAGGTTPFTTTIYKVDSLGRVIARYGTDGVATTTQYDPDGNVIQSIQYDVTGTSSSVQKSDLESSTLDLHHMGLTNKRITSTRYDNFDRPIAVLDPMGNVSWTYYDNAGRVTKTLDPRASANIAPADTGKPGVDYTTQAFWMNSVTPVPAANGAYVTAFDYDGAGQLIKKTLPSASSAGTDHIDSTYYPNGSIKTQKDANGNITTYNYDLANHKTYRHDPTVTDANSATTTYNPYETDYNLDGTVKSEKDENLDVTSYTYDSRGRVVTMTQQNPTGASTGGPVTTYTYDQAGNLIDTLDPTGVHTQKSYDALGRVLSIKTVMDSYGVNTASTGDSGREINLNTNAPVGTFKKGDYVEIDNMSWNQTITPVGSSSGTNIPVSGGVFQVTDVANYMNHATVIITPVPPPGNTIQNWWTNLDLSMTTVTKFLGETSTKYTDNQVTQTIDANHNRTTIKYSFFDSNGLFNRTVDQYVASPAMGGDGSHLSHKTYDALGELESSTQYKSSGSVGPVTTAYAYDFNGRVIEEVDPPKSGNASITITGYDAAGNPAFTIQPKGSAALPSVDGTSNSTWLGNVRGALAAVQTGTVPASAGAMPLYQKINPDVQSNLDTITYTYDAQNRKLTETQPDLDGKTSTTTDRPKTTWTYDKNGNVKTMADPTTPTANTTTYTYDELNREIKEETYVYENSGDTNHDVTRKYFYDGVGNLTKSIDRNGGKIVYAPDHLDRVSTEQWFLYTNTTTTPDHTLTYSYDPDNRVTSIVDSIPGSVSSRLDYQYDDVGNETVCSQTGPDGTQVNLNQSFDLNGNRTQVQAQVNIPGQISQRDFVNQYAYNEFNQMIGVWQHDSATDTTFGTYTDPQYYYHRGAISGRASIFGYNLMGQLTSINDYKSVDANGWSNLAFGTTPSGSKTALTAAQQTWTYGTGEMMLSSINGPTAQEYSYQWNVDGTMSSMHVDGVIRSFGYDSNDQLTSEPSKTYGYDSNGNRITGPGAGVAGTGQTDHGIGADNRIKKDATWTYSYDGEGNMTQKVNNADGSKWTYTYDNRNRMTDAVEKNAAGTTTLSQEHNVYDAQDRRISKTVDGATEQYVYDGDKLVLVINPNATLDDGSTPWPTMTQRFMWGPNPDQIISDETLTTDPSSNQPIYTERHFVSDHEGSVRKVVDDSSGLVTQTLDYDVFGNLVSSDAYASGVNGVTAYNTDASHWTILGGSVTTARSATIVTGGPDAWAKPDGASWISIRDTGSSDGGLGPHKNNSATYTYTTTITVAAGSGVSSIKGFVAADNELDDISVNGVSSGVKFLVDPSNDGDPGPFQSWHSFTLSGLHAGANTIVFTVKDWSGWTGLAVMWGTSTVSSSGIANDPKETSQFLFQGMMWNPNTNLYSMGGGSIYFDPTTNRRTIEDPANEGTNPYAIEANNDNSNRDYNGANVAFGGSNFGYLDPSKVSVTNINVGGGFSSVSNAGQTSFNAGPATIPFLSPASVSSPTGPGGYQYGYGDMIAYGVAPLVGDFYGWMNGAPPITQPQWVQQVSTRAGGASQAAFSAAAAIVTAPAALTVVGGGAFLTSLDNARAGTKTLFTGMPSQTVTSSTVSNGLQWAGVSQSNANLVGEFTNFAASAGFNYAAMNNLPALTSLSDERWDTVSNSLSNVLGPPYTVRSGVLRLPFGEVEGNGISIQTPSQIGMSGAGGRLGNVATRDQIFQISQELENRGWKVIGGGGGPEEFIPGFSGGAKGGAYPDITAIKNGRTLRINTVSTLSDGVTPTLDEARRAANLRSLLEPGQHLLMVPKTK